MEIIHLDQKKGTAQLKVTENEDYWYLSQVIEPGDLVRGKTTRKIKIGDGENAKVTKKTINVKIEAEDIEFSSESLRINGKIKDGPEDLPRESYQSITLGLGDDFYLEKPCWPSYQVQKLKEAAEQRSSHLICLFDREEAFFALTKRFGHELLLQLKGDVPKKNQQNNITKDFQEEIIKNLSSYFQRFQPESIILASPVFYKDDLFKRISSPELRKKIILANSSSVTEKAIDELIKSPELAKVLRNSRTREEQLAVEELLSALNKDLPAVYGEKDVQKAADSGAISALLITDDFIKRRREQKTFLPIEQLMKKVDSFQAKIHFISSEHDGGKKLNGLGGIAALLRYKI
jgi:protein pelota